ncbi:protein of unknown function [Cardinium endosymbiont cEper1 of Encarsia pergandiella]|nr:protein of unknown function [Cardinium endosymbiont cEper1 of Encarsia pergandiella]
MPFVKGEGQLVLEGLLKFLIVKFHRAGLHSIVKVLLQYSKVATRLFYYLS